MLYILFGQDDYSRSQFLAGIKADIGDETILTANTTLIRGQQITLDGLRGVCDAVPFLSEKRLVVIEGLMERFEPKGKTKRPPAKRKKEPQRDYQLWADYLASVPVSTVAVLLDGKLSDSNPLLNALKGRAQIKPFPLLNRTRLRQWVDKTVAEAGGEISPSAADLLTRLVGSNLHVMKQEIEKLVLYAMGRTIVEADIEALVSDFQQANVYTMVDAILEAKPGVAEKALQRLLSQGAVPAYLLVMISRQIRMIARIKELQSQGVSNAGIQSRLGLSSEYVFRKTLEQARRYPQGRVGEMYSKLLEADLAVKTSKYDGELALDILIGELCRRG
ncbi:DNA polymerase III subunit delta [Chloroflexota bacterium]